MKLMGCSILSAILAGGSCGRQPGSPLQEQFLESPGGSYVLSVPIRVNPEYGGAEVWAVTIEDPEGNILYSDGSSEFVAGLNVYWCWDEEDRVWLYNSDDGRVWFWEAAGTEWRKTLWGCGSDHVVTGGAPAPPDSLVQRPE